MSDVDDKRQEIITYATMTDNPSSDTMAGLLAELENLLQAGHFDRPPDQYAGATQLNYDTPSGYPERVPMRQPQWVGPWEPAP